MFARVKLDYKIHRFLLKDKFYIDPIDVTPQCLNSIIGYCLGDNLVMSINSSNSDINWSLRIGDEINDLIHDRNCYDGRYNTKVIVNYCLENNINLLEYPPIFYCLSCGKDDWYFPSIDELKVFGTYKEIFLSNCLISGVKTNLNNRSIWSSTLVHRGIVNCLTSINDVVWSYPNWNAYILPFLKI